MGLSTATGMMPPERLVNASSRPNPGVAGARADVYRRRSDCRSARIAAALGVFSSQSLLDLYAASFDATDPDALGETEAWQLRLAYIGKDLDARLSAMRTIWGNAQSPLDRVAAQVLAVAGSATCRAKPRAAVRRARPGRLSAGRRIRPRSGALGPSRSAKWTTSRPTKVWAMLALGAPDSLQAGDQTASRIEDFADRDQSEGKQRTALLVAGLAGLGRIDAATAGNLNRTYQLGLAAETGWTRMIDGAMRRRQSGTPMLLTASALQGAVL